jgi:hypothetical protein
MVVAMVHARAKFLRLFCALIIGFFVATCAQVSPANDDLPRARSHHLALASVSSTHRRTRSHSLRVKSKGPIPSGWFGDFSQDESTYTASGLNAYHDDPAFDVEYGRDPSIASPSQNSQVLDSKFFHESQSGGPKEAWQTHYPSVRGSIAGNHMHENPWRYTASGWKQEYVPVTDDVTDMSPTAMSPMWFDSSVRQIDGYGRQQTPSSADGRLYADGWLERSVNTTVTCKDIGCVGRASLRMYDATHEEARLCKLAIYIHPTDYDDDYSREHVKYWKVNGYIAARQCNPRVRGCNHTADLPLYPCVNQYTVDRIIDGNGTVVIEGENTHMVDECPINGNLLSAVAIGTCMVRNKTAPVKPKNKTDAVALMAEANGEAVLKCAEPGCKAEAKVHFNPALALNGGKCTMTVNVTQTDYDDHLGRPEEVEYIAVGGKNITTKPVQPGKNPCNIAYSGNKLTDAEKFFEAVKSYDVTEMAKTSHPAGTLKVSGKISPQVDECGHEGNLFYATVVVNCTPPAALLAMPPKLLLRESDAASGLKKGSHTLLHQKR